MYMKNRVTFLLYKRVEGGGVVEGGWREGWVYMRTEIKKKLLLITYSTVYHPIWNDREECGGHHHGRITICYIFVQD